MPVKRRAHKRRIDDLPVWSMLFLSGYDYFDDVQDLTGLVEPVRIPMGDDREAARIPWHAAALEAWERLGPDYLSTFEGDAEPWALVEFGKPWEMNNAD